MATMPPELCGAVQTNCHISDARHASDYTLCIYLLKMREYYRWELGYSFSETLPKDEVGNWLVAREALWEELEEASFEALTIDGQTYDPFEAEAINRVLLPKGHVYSAGLGLRATPHFFLGTLEKHEEYNGFSLLVASDECARDLTAPPAMTQSTDQGDTIFIRRESVRRLVWEKVQEWRWHQYENAMSRALAYYDFEKDLDAALEAMTGNEIESITLHEIGEVISGRYLGGEWAEMILSLPRSKGEIMARAVRDHLADSLSTLPGLLEEGNAAALHFYMANLTAMRKDLFPGFGEAYQRWVETGDIRVLRQLVSRGAHHWLEVGAQMLNIYHQHGDQCMPQLESLITSSRL